jgi:hypothetical protein
MTLIHLNEVDSPLYSNPKLSVAKIAFEGFEWKAVPQGRPFALTGLFRQVY